MRFHGNRRLGRSNQILLGEQNRNEHKAEDNIHHRACDHNEEALPHGFWLKARSSSLASSSPSIWT